MSLVVDRVTKRFGPVLALDRMTFSVPPGEIFGFLGANGAGKTTTMRIVLGVLRADEGQVTWHGRPSAELPRRTWGYLPEERGLYPRTTVLDQLVYFASLYGVAPERARREARAWLARFRIAEHADRRAEELSKGNQQKVQLVAAILHDPEVLLMDEPFTGLDPVNAAMLREAFVEMRQRGKTLVFSTHQMETVEALCESVAIVDRGRVVLGGPVRALKRASGRRRVRLSMDGDERRHEWLERIPGARVTRAGLDVTELELDPGIEPDAVLAAALGRGARISRFEVADPSLEQLFIDHVGRPAGDEAHLAPAAAARSVAESPVAQDARFRPADENAPAGGA